MCFEFSSATLTAPNPLKWKRTKESRRYAFTSGWLMNICCPSQAGDTSGMGVGSHMGSLSRMFRTAASSWPPGSSVGLNSGVWGFSLSIARAYHLNGARHHG